MTDQIISGVVTVATAIVGIAVLAVLVSGRSQTSNVIKSAGGAFSQAVSAAVSPVTGSSGASMSPSLFTGGMNPGYPEYY